ncbi:MAG: hypothetical protein ACPGN3_05150 [Opitutales bacterium]
MSSWGVGYDELLFGKPEAAIFIDDKALNVEDWKKGDFRLPGIVD